MPPSDEVCTHTRVRYPVLFCFFGFGSGFGIQRTRHALTSADCDAGAAIKYTATRVQGLIDGNNSPSGDGVMFESGGSAAHGITHGLVEDVTVTNQGNGCFGAWGVSNIVFKDVQVSHTHCNWTDGRSPPSSGALVFGAGAEGTPPIQSAGIQIVNATYNTLCKQNLFWPGSAFSKMDAVEGGFAPSEPLHLQFCFDE